MTIHLAYSEADERRHVSAIYRMLLASAFQGGRQFYHDFMSPGEALASSLAHFDAIVEDGPSVVLRRPADQILRQIEASSLADLPLIEDALSVLLGFLAQYSTVPKLTRPDQFANFDPAASRLFQQMGLLDSEFCPQPSFWPILVNHYFLVPHLGEWAPHVRDLLSDICQRTWASAPQDFKDVVSGQTERPLTWAMGYLELAWRYGTWLDARQKLRAQRQHHLALPGIVVKTLAHPDGGVFVARGHLPKRLT